MGWTSRVAVGGLGAAVLAAGVWTAGGLASVASADAAIDGLVVNGRVTSTVNSFWFGQMNRDGLCNVMAGCLAARGEGDSWVLTIAMPVAIPGVSSVDVNVQVTERVPLKSMSLKMTYSSAQLGDLDASMTVSLSPRGGDTDVVLTMEKVTATGAIATGVSSFASALQPRMTATMAQLSEDRVIAGTKVRLAISRSGKATVVVTGKGLAKGSPVASGTVYMVAGDKVVCTGNVSRSRGSCKLPKLAPGTEVRATVVGQFDNGYPIWNSDADEVRR